MAIEMFMRMEGVVGGSRNYHHKGWSDVLSWRWALARGVDASEPATMNELHLSKAIGMDSASMLALFAADTPIATTELSMVPVVGKRDQQQKYVAIRLEDVRIAAITTGGGEEENFFREDVILRFARVNYEYFEYAAASVDSKAAPGQGYTFGWDLVNKTPC